MTTSLVKPDVVRPDPLNPPGLDVRDLDGFMLNTDRLLASELWALSTGEEFKAAMGLWCRAWKQIPAGSLPNDERVLASFAGVTPSRWAKVRAVALRGFVECSDGRLYHRTLCEDARRAFGWKEARDAERDGDADRKRREREDRARLFAELRAAGRVLPYNTPTSELRVMAATPSQPNPAPVTRDASQEVTVFQRQDSTGQDKTKGTRAPDEPERDTTDLYDAKAERPEPVAGRPPGLLELRQVAGLKLIPDSHAAWLALAADVGLEWITKARDELVAAGKPCWCDDVGAAALRLRGRHRANERGMAKVESDRAAADQRTAAVEEGRLRAVGEARALLERFEPHRDAAGAVLCGMMDALSHAVYRSDHGEPVNPGMALRRARDEFAALRQLAHAERN